MTLEASELRGFFVLVGLIVALGSEAHGVLAGCGGGRSSRFVIEVKYGTSEKLLPRWMSELGGLMATYDSLCKAGE